MSHDMLNRLVAAVLVGLFEAGAAYDAMAGLQSMLAARSGLAEACDVLGGRLYTDPFGSVCIEKE